MLSIKTLKSMLLFSLLGAAVSTICDLNHAYTGALSYPEPFIYLQPWWPFPGFTIAFFTMAFLYFKLSPLMPFNYNKLSTKTNNDIKPFVESLIIYMLIYLISGFGHKESNILIILFYGLFFIRIIFSYDRIFILITAIILAIGGVIGEGLLIKFNLVLYKNPEIFGVPYWLGGVYMHGAMALREGMRFFVYHQDNKC